MLAEAVVDGRCQLQVSEPGTACCEAELHRSRGDLLRIAGNPGEARLDDHQAFSVAGLQSPGTAVSDRFCQILVEPGQARRSA
ncbi:MAG: hypothetical protein ACJ8AW_07295 [Rhodopila sp.]